MSMDETIELLKKVIRDPNCKEMNKSTVKGYLAELIVMNKLQSEQADVTHIGNQGGFDILYKKNGKELKINVKCSEFKDEFRLGCKYWGWALQHGSGEKDFSATHYVCVGLDDDFNEGVLVVIPCTATAAFPPGIRQFRNVKHSLIVFKDVPALDEKKYADVLEFNKTSEQLLKKAGVKKLENLGETLADKLA